eukprot:Plantae.Rhodophyta-Palmaria_palmata.ctg127.p2 GENE.Plantae.Rhodophyta-Palmaria_palmata.ctg127~~Plantae.Rhodophyta-Palmaria_palmata.ctg127.p2  ORF type:complete len:131 (-),score=18.43 Plantae.Rhodophyta-Palmaria_palmata.ctg127:530-922(-)
MQQEKTRQIQIVSSLSDREKVKSWMRAKLSTGATRIAGKALLQFSHAFRFVDRIGRQSFMKKAQRYLADAKYSLSEAESLQIANERKAVGPRGQILTLVSTRRRSGICRKEVMRKLKVEEVARGSNGLKT